jgi:hypothetical protein
MRTSPGFCAGIVTYRHWRKGVDHWDIRIITPASLPCSGRDRTDSEAVIIATELRGAIHPMCKLLTTSCFDASILSTFTVIPQALESRA